MEQYSTCSTFLESFAVAVIADYGWSFGILNHLWAYIFLRPLETIALLGRSDVHIIIKMRNAGS
jgi:hypothetical protein